VGHLHRSLFPMEFSNQSLTSRDQRHYAARTDDAVKSGLAEAHYDTSDAYWAVQNEPEAIYARQCSMCTAFKRFVAALWHAKINQNNRTASHKRKRFTTYPPTR